MPAAVSASIIMISSLRMRSIAGWADNRAEPWIEERSVESQNEKPFKPAPGPKLPPYGMSITNEQAKRVAAAALKPARENQWTMVVAIVDTGGHLVYLEKLDQTQVGSVDIAIAKAKSSAIFKRP